jgi:sugar lactone lactonase YvrE
VESDLPDNRFNDGKCDPQGRFWAGTMDAVHWSAPTGNLFRMNAEGSVELMQSNVICSNGSGWSPDGSRMYYTESFRYAIFVYDFAPASGAISNRRLFARNRQQQRRISRRYDGRCRWLCVEQYCRPGANSPIRSSRASWNESFSCPCPARRIARSAEKI